MARLLMNLRGVPDDEADDVRALLAEHGVDYYETPPGRWWISMGAIWLADEADYERVRALLDDYQARRRERARAEHARQRAEGTADTIVDVVRRQPLRVLVYAAICAGLLYLTVRPFFGW